MGSTVGMVTATSLTSQLDYWPQIAKKRICRVKWLMVRCCWRIMFTNMKITVVYLQSTQRS